MSISDGASVSCSRVWINDQEAFLPVPGPPSLYHDSYLRERYDIKGGYWLRHLLI